jgi:hypothetical protein
VLGSTGLVAGAGLWIAGFSGQRPAAEEKDTQGKAAQGKPAAEKPEAPQAWKVVPVDKSQVAAEAVRLYFEGGCMYGVFASIIGLMGKVAGEPYRSFPFQMMRYGEGGAGGYGSLCGALNGGAAAIGLFEMTKERREQVIGELFSWYETTELPIHTGPGAAKLEPTPKSVAHSVLCHVSVSRWCQSSGFDMLDKERKQRCSLLTADVALKTLDLIERNQQPSSKFTAATPEAKSCLVCHGKQELRNAQGRMQCNCCHTLPEKHPGK